MASYPKLSVIQVRTAVPASTGVEAGMIVLQEDAHPRRSLRIIIGSTEAKAIHTAWQGTIGGRPTTWDVFVSAMALLGARITRVVITAVEQERHYFATLEIEDDGITRSLSCRPSDGIALALRAYGCEIVAAEEVLMTAGVLPDGSRPEPQPEPFVEPEPIVEPPPESFAAPEPLVEPPPGSFAEPGPVVEPAPESAVLAEPESHALAEAETQSGSSRNVADSAVGADEVSGQG